MDDDDQFDYLFEDGGYFTDDGEKIDIDKVPIPLLCLSCVSFGAKGKENVLCNLTRADQQDEKIFRCHAYRLEDRPKE